MANGKAGKAKDSAPALYEAGLRHFQSGRIAVAEERCRKALAADPEHADSLHLLGLIHAQGNRVDLAIDFIAQAIRSNQGNAEYFSNLGSLLVLRNQFEEALKSYDLALKLKPDLVNVWIRLGDLLQKQKRDDEALLTFEHALTLDPRHVEAADKSALLLLRLGRHAEALARFALSDAIEPGRPHILSGTALCLTALARREEAAAVYGRLIAMDPANCDGLNDLGGVLLDLRRYQEAIVHFRKAIALRPDCLPAINNLALALIHLRRFDEAVSLLGDAIARSPAVPELFNNRGNALRTLGRLDEALADYDRAIALKSDYIDACCNRGACLDDLMRPDEAEASYRRALALAPEHGDSHWNLAVNRLRAGDLRNGWIESEWRWRSGSLGITQLLLDKPLWLGAESVDGKTLLLHGDQGLGDAIQFCRYVPLLAARGARVILQVDGPLTELLSGVEGVSQCIANGEPLPGFDLHCPMASLPLAFDTTLATIPAGVPYIPLPEPARDWPDWLGERTCPRIGLVWSGNPNHLNDHNRSVPLEKLLPLFDVGAQFVSLQKGARERDRALLAARRDIRDAEGELASFADTASLIRQLDLVISVDTSVAHLSGALGKPVWVLLPYVPDWRWLLGRDDSPWYPTARLFRQTDTRQWESVVAHVRTALREFVAQAPAR